MTLDANTTLLEFLNAAIQSGGQMVVTGVEGSAHNPPVLIVGAVGEAVAKLKEILRAQFGATFEGEAKAEPSRIIRPGH